MTLLPNSFSLPVGRGPPYPGPGELETGDRPGLKEEQGGPRQFQVTFSFGTNAAHFEPHVARKLFLHLVVRAGPTAPSSYKEDVD